MEHEVSLPHSQLPTTRAYPEPAQSSHVLPSYLLRARFNIIPRLRLSSNRSLFLRQPQQNLVCNSISQRATYSVHLIILDFIAQVMWWGVQIMKLVIMQFLRSPVTSSLLDPNILLSTLFANTLCLRSSRHVADKFHGHVQQACFSSVRFNI
jgi:hypothetical protein